MNEELEMEGRAAIVTGGSRGLGQAIAGAFLQSGASVLIAARDAARLLAAREELMPRARPGRLLLAVAADVSTAEGCAAVMDGAAPLLPELSVLVCNAGVLGAIGRLEDVAWEDWLSALQVNLLGAVLMCRAVVPHLRRRGYGKIVTVSGGGATSPLPRFSAYAASKAALVRFTETLAHELKGDRVDVNALAPGLLHTRMLDEVIAAGPERVGAEFHASCVQQRAEGATPLEKGAALAVFLASARSDGITGRLISAVWDDWTNLAARREELAGTDWFTLRRVSPDSGAGQR
jgi:NAD(P)-dependent dehydrogenase (short-subunit alcohol dehydrogenase family)